MSKVSFTIEKPSCSHSCPFRDEEGCCTLYYAITTGWKYCETGCKDFTPCTSCEKSFPEWCPFNSTIDEEKENE